MTVAAKGKGNSAEFLESNNDTGTAEEGSLNDSLSLDNIIDDNASGDPKKPPPPLYQQSASDFYHAQPGLSKALDKKRMLGRTGRNAANTARTRGSRTRSISPKRNTFSGSNRSTVQSIFSEEGNRSVSTMTSLRDMKKAALKGPPIREMKLCAMKEQYSKSSNAILEGSTSWHDDEDEDDKDEEDDQTDIPRPPRMQKHNTVDEGILRRIKNRSASHINRITEP